MKNIAVLGLGSMGRRMAENYLDAGHSVQLWNRSEVNIESLVKKGAKKYSTVKEAVQSVDVVITMLRDDNASKEVWLDSKDGVLAILDSKTIAIECSTLSSDWVKSLSKVFEEAKIEFLHAPVIGSRPQADAKQLVHLLGGKRETFEQVEELLLASALNIHYVGDVKDASSMKLAVNGIFGMQITALAETLGLLERQGISKEKAVSLFNQLPITSPALQGVGLAMIHENYEPLFPIDLVEKDFAYLSEMLTTHKGLKSPIQTTHQLYKKAKEEGYAKDNIVGVIQVFE